MIYRLNIFGKAYRTELDVHVVEERGIIDIIISEPKKCIVRYDIGMNEK